MAHKKSLYTTDAEPTDAPAIDAFRGEWEFLSNFYAHPVEVNGMTYPTTEHAFQALKTHEATERYEVQQAKTPSTAKARGKKVTLRPDWNTERFAAMEAVLRAKFANPDLRAKLLATGDRELIEGNTWRDTTWGCIKDSTGAWKGQNALGKILMKLRDEMRSDPNANDDQQDLIGAALTARVNAYAPHSGYHVGAAIRTDGGQVFGGCNVENASYGLCNCAERTAIFAAVAKGAISRDVPLRAVAVVTDDGGTPCGACRQVMVEFAPKSGETVPVYLCSADGTVVRETSLAELLPLAFTLR